MSDRLALAMCSEWRSFHLGGHHGLGQQHEAIDLEAAILVAGS
jgi:hypothetical protein